MTLPAEVTHFQSATAEARKLSAEWEASFTLERQVKEARREIGERRWAELQAEWNTP